MERLPNAHPADFGSVAFAAARTALLPSEALSALLQRLAHISARDAATVTAVEGLMGRRVDVPNRDLVETELLRSLVQQRLNRGRHLILARAPLRSARRRVGQHRHPPVAHV